MQLGTAALVGRVNDIDERPGALADHAGRFSHSSHHLSVLPLLLSFKPGEPGLDIRLPTEHVDRAHEASHGSQLEPLKQSHATRLRDAHRLNYGAGVQ